MSPAASLHNPKEIHFLWTMNDNFEGQSIMSLLGDITRVNNSGKRKNQKWKGSVLHGEYHEVSWSRVGRFSMTEHDHRRHSTHRYPQRTISATSHPALIFKSSQIQR